MLIFDSDGLIKLSRSKVLGVVVRSYDSLVPAAVYDEVVMRGYEDAADIEKTLDGSVAVESPEIRDNVPALDRLVTGLGDGATQALHFALRMGQGSTVVSDDQRFLGVLSDLSIKTVIPSHIILGLARDKVLSVPDSKGALIALRPFIRPSDYFEAIEELGE